jgi:hypothetical protein
MRTGENIDVYGYSALVIFPAARQAGFSYQVPILASSADIRSLFADKSLLLCNAQAGNCYPYGNVGGLSLILLSPRS